ncbi:MAG: hypothetical protein JSV33_08815 [bacterium]|nr:MAG: hypothetical protein JSV33_08815 [bacterium]
MMNAASPTVIEESKHKFEEILNAKRLLDVHVSVTVRPLTPEEAIGSPQRQDFPIIEGKERVIEADVLGAKGHAFTDSPRNFSGTMRDVLELPLTTNQNRGVFIAVLNAMLRHLEEIEGTVHCKNEDPEKCAKEIAGFVWEKRSGVKVGLIGLNPAIAEALISTFGEENVTVSDLNRDNVGKKKYGVTIVDGRDETDTLIERSDFVVITGTTLVNGTFDAIMQAIGKLGKDYLVYGVTGSGVCHLQGLNRMCPYGRDR